MPHRELRLSYPVWIFTAVDFDRAYETREARMGLAIALARYFGKTVEEVFDADS